MSNSLVVAMLSRLLLFAIGPLLVALGPVPLQAQATTRSAQDLANLAYERFQAGATEAGLDLYHSALAKARGPLRVEILVNLGKAYAQLTRYAEAWSYLHEAAEVSTEQRVALRDALAFLEGELGAGRHLVHVESRPPGAEVTLLEGGRAHRRVAPFQWWLPNGPLRLHAELSGYEARDQRFARAAVASGRLILAMVRERPKESPLATKPTGGPHPQKTASGETSTEAPTAAGRFPAALKERDGDSLALWGWISLGGGAGLVLAGVGTWIGAMGKASDVDDASYSSTAAYDARWEDEVQPLTTTSYVLWGVGGAAAIAGTVLLLADGSDGRTSLGMDGPRFFAAPTPNGGLGLHLGASF